MYWRIPIILFATLALTTSIIALPGCSGGGGRVSSSYHVHSGFGVGYGWSGGRYIVDRPIIIGPGIPIDPPVEPPPVPELPIEPPLEAIPY